MKRFLDILMCVIKSKKFFFIKKKDFLIFDCENTDILKKILPEEETYILSTRLKRVKTILINFEMIFFITKNLFTRSIQLNYYICLIRQLKPKFVITQVDNSISFSLLSKYFENEIKFLAIQCSTRGDIYDDRQGFNRLRYFTNYMTLSDVDVEILKEKKITVKKFISAGSLRNSYFKNFILPNNEKKKYDICLVCATIYKNGLFLNNNNAKGTLEIARLLSQYVRKYNRSIVIQSKGTEDNYLEKKFYEENFANTNYKLSWKDNSNFISYKNISSSSLVIGPPSTLLREASIYSKVKILCFELEDNIGKKIFHGINYFNQTSFNEFEKKINYLLDLSYENYLEKLDKPHNYLMQNTNTVNQLLNFLGKSV